MTVLTRDGLDRLVDELVARGYRVIGPTVRNEAIVLGELTSGDQLPAGWGVETAPGHYRLRRRADAAVFGHSSGPQSWKQFLHPAREKLWSADRDGAEPAPFRPADGRGARPTPSPGFTVTATESEPPRYAFLGVRGCDLAAIGMLDRVLDRGGHPDSRYHRRRAGIFIVGANCTEPGEVCFCTSMGTGPQVGPGYDLALTERIDARGHRFVVDVGTEKGAEVLAALPTLPAEPGEVQSARAEVDAAAGRMDRAMPAANLPDVLAASRESPHWAEVASRCLTCANCTMVCPTCFCTATEDVIDLSGDHAERWESWSSCFELDYSYLHGGEVRSSGASRYRQWLTHKLGTWYDQFGTSGCVGCGRCIAWCPAEIDITVEMDALVEEQSDD